MILENIREAIKKTGISRYRIAKETGVDQTVLHRIFKGGGCSIETANTLMEYLGLKIIQKKQKRGK